MNSTSFFTNRMHLTEEGVALYVDALKLKRTSELPKEMLKHVEHCPDCQLQIVELHEMLKDEIYDTSVKHPYFDNEVREPAVRYRIPYYRVAAVVSGAALLGIGYYFTATPHSIQAPQSIAQQQSIPQASQELFKDPVKPTQSNEKGSLLADNFSASPNMEDLVQTQFRSISVEIITPKSGEIVQQPIEFRWKNIGEPLTLKILSNKERILVSAPLTENSYTTRKKFAPGLYYWKLETKDELIFVGKFLIK